MKKTISLILFVLVISFTNGQSARKNSALEKFSLKPIEFVFDEQLRKIDKETGVLRVNPNAFFKLEGSSDAVTIAWAYLQANSDLYGINFNQVNFSHITESPSGNYVYFRQYISGTSVGVTNFTVYVNRDNVVTYTLNEFRNVTSANNSTSVSLFNEHDALEIVIEYLSIKGDFIRDPIIESIYFESIGKGLELAWLISIISEEHPLGWLIVVSANYGRIIHAEIAGRPANGTSKVFNPSPLVSAGVPYGYGNCYQHNNWTNNPCLENQMIQVTLRDLTFENGLYKLKGPYVTVERFRTLTTHIIPELPTQNFNFTRDQEEFAAVMAYYHVDLAARRILELGYEIPDHLKRIKIDPHGTEGRNAFYIQPFSNFILLGSSFGNRSGNAFVPAAEDADVIWHEYAHAIFWTFGANSIPFLSLPGITWALFEGSADYWATSYKRSLYPNDWQAYARWFDMDHTPWIPRRTDLDWVYPVDYYNASCCHYRGQIWSSALMKIWGDLGRDTTDMLFLEAHLIWGLSPSIRDGAAAFIQADLHLFNGIHFCQLYSRFQEHGLIDPNWTLLTTSFVNQIVTTNTIAIGCSDLEVQSVTIANNATLTLKANGDINLQNVVVEPGSKLILDATGKIHFGPGFKIELGAELKIIP